MWDGEICLTNNGIDECKTPDGGELGCCVIPAGNCREAETIARCNGNQGIAWFLETDCSEVPECEVNVVSAVPTLSEWGLIAIAVILGIIGFMVIRRKNY